MVNLQEQNTITTVTITTLIRSITIAILCIAIVSSSIQLAIAQTDDGSYAMDPAEQEAAYQVLEAINSEVSWRAQHPDNLCLYGPHGLNCDTDDRNILHIVELSFGWVAENDNNPDCSENATISPAIAKLPYLRKLLFYKCFTQKPLSLPSALSHLNSSALLNLAFIQNPAVVGGVPSKLASLSPKLERLVLQGNSKLGGKIPPELAELKSLQELVLSDNGLIGDIPEEIGSFPKLKVLDLRGNSLSGEMPWELAKLKNLKKLDLCKNNLSGPIPAGLGKSLDQLELLDLSCNCLTGGVPAELGLLGSLRVLDLSGNGNLSGQIPDALADMRRLEVLRMSGAGLLGRVPASLGALQSLSSLDLSDNELEGGIAFTLGRLPSIYRVNLRNNKLVGVVPLGLALLGSNLRIEGNPGLCLTPRGDCHVDQLDLFPQRFSDNQYSIPSSSASQMYLHRFISVLVLGLLFLSGHFPV